jgi:hypothetical protein
MDKELKAGDIVLLKVVDVKDFGAFLMQVWRRIFSCRKRNDWSSKKRRNVF